MHLVIVAWIYVAFMMAVAEATNTTGTLLGAAVTFVLYGVLPVALLAYLMRTPARRAARRARERAGAPAHGDGARAGAGPASIPPDLCPCDPDAGGHASAAAEPPAVAPVRKEP